MPAAILLAALPWLNPVGAGPSTLVVPWLTTGACALLLWLLAPSTPRLPGRLLVLAGSLVLVAWLPHPETSQQIVFLAAGIVLMLVAMQAAGVPDIALAVERGTLLAASLSAVMGLVQYFGASAPLDPWVNLADPGVAYGNLRQPNQFTTLCWLGMAVLLWGRVRLPRGAAYALAVLLAVASAASVSRTAIVQGFVLTLLALAWRSPERRSRVLLCGAAAVAYFAASFILPLLLEATGVVPPRTLAARLGGVDACSSRLVLWSNVLRVIAQRPWLGWGWGELDFAHFMTLYPDLRFCNILDNAHNLPLHLAAEAGVPVAVTVSALFAWWVWRQAPWREGTDSRRLAWAVLALVLVHSMVEYPLWYGPFQFVAGAAAGWLILPRELAPRPTSRRPRAVLAAALLAATAYVGWDYARVTQMYVLPENRLAPWRDNTIQHALRTWLFTGQAWFAVLTVSTLDRRSAQNVHDVALEVLHYSPEPRVIERVIESATMLGRDDEAVLYLARYRAAFPESFQAWRTAVHKPTTP
jgi:O-antigen ligase